MKHKIDVSIVVTVQNDDSRYLARCLASLNEAAAFAGVEGIATELLTLHSRQDAKSKAVVRSVDLSAFKSVKSVEGDNGLFRQWLDDTNKNVSGQYIMTVSGDDIVSYSSISRMLSAANQNGRDQIFIPKFVLAFNAEYYSVEYFDQDKINLSEIIKYSLFPGVIFAHRSLFLLNDNSTFSGASEDPCAGVDFNSGLIALGYRFCAVEGTVLFRRKDADVGLPGATDIALPILPPSPLFDPHMFLRKFSNIIYRYEELKSNSGEPPLFGVELFYNKLYRDIIIRANSIEPSVEIGRYLSSCRGYFSNFVAPKLGVAYSRICEIVGDSRFEAVFLVTGAMPNQSSDPAIEAMEEFVDRNPRAQVLALVDEDTENDILVRLLAASVVVVQLQRVAHGLSIEDRDVLCLRLLQACAATATIHFATLTFGQRFLGRFGRHLHQNHIVCYRTSDRIVDLAGFRLVASSPFEFLAENLDVVDEIIALDPEAMDLDRWRLPDIRLKYRVPVPRQGSVLEKVR